MKDEEIKLEEIESSHTLGGSWRCYGGLEHRKIETRLIDERFESVMGECVI